MSKPQTKTINAGRGALTLRFLSTRATCEVVGLDAVQLTYSWIRASVGEECPEHLAVIRRDGGASVADGSGASGWPFDFWRFAWEHGGEFDATEIHSDGRLFATVSAGNDENPDLTIAEFVIPALQAPLQVDADGVHELEAAVRRITYIPLPEYWVVHELAFSDVLLEAEPDLRGRTAADASEADT